MALKYKIMLLLGFMAIITVIVAGWFFNRLNHYIYEFKDSLEQDKAAFEVSQQRSIQQLEKKAQALKDEAKEHFKKVEAGILGDPQGIKDFYEDFSHKQNRLFDEIDKIKTAK